MFYDESMQEELRFGDVLKGLIFTTPNVEEPILLSTEEHNYSIDVGLSGFSVVITPCCSIGNKMISLSPLVRVRSSLFRNPYFAEDLTRINRLMEPRRAIPPGQWKAMSSEEKQRRLDEGPIYACFELFIYEKHDLFPVYTIGGNETNYHMIDFRNVYRLNCGKITRQNPILTGSKRLQLSVQTRKELRDKTAHYYGRTPEEDKLVLES